MDISEFKAGTIKKGYQYQYFSPEKVNHTFVWSDKTINQLLESASLKLGELNSFSKFVPDTDMFIRAHVYKEAVVSSRIEGTRTNLQEALNDEDEIQPERRNDWKEVKNYVEAMNHAIKELETLPLSNRLIKNTHRILLTSVRGEHKAPGEFRTSQNWIGGATLTDAIFIPPAQTEVLDLMSDLELFLQNTAIEVPHLVKIAIAHYQFETIHPFLDGNGRIGRLLIPLYFVSNQILEKPLLYISEFFERNKSKYFDNLTRVREKNDLTQWVKFFLIGIIETATAGVATLKKIVDLKQEIESKKLPLLGKRHKNGTELLNHIFLRPLVSVKEVQESIEVSNRAANELVKAFVEQEILVEITGFSRNRVFEFEGYLRLFNEGEG